MNQPLSERTGTPRDEVPHAANLHPVADLQLRDVPAIFLPGVPFRIVRKCGHDADVVALRGQMLAQSGCKWRDRGSFGKIVDSKN